MKRRAPHRPEQDALYHRLATAHDGMIARLARSSEADPGRQEDLRQSIHLALWRSLAAFKGQCSEKTWTYRVAHNVAADHIRSDMRRDRTLVDLDGIEALHDPDNPLATVEREDALQHLRQWIARLTLPDRQIATLYLEDLSAAEIADITGLSPGNVAVRLSRLKTKITAHFEPHVTVTARTS